MQLLPIGPLQAPRVWAEWSSRLDPASWVLIANTLIESLDPFALSYGELLLVSDLLDTRDAMLSDLMAALRDTAH